MFIRNYSSFLLYPTSFSCQNIFCFRFFELHCYHYISCLPLIGMFITSSEFTLCWPLIMAFQSRSWGTLQVDIELMMLLISLVFWVRKKMSMYLFVCISTVSLLVQKNHQFLGGLLRPWFYVSCCYLRVNCYFCGEKVQWGPRPWNLEKNQILVQFPLAILCLWS